MCVESKLVNLEYSSNKNKYIELNLFVERQFFI